MDGRRLPFESRLDMTGAEVLVAEREFELERDLESDMGIEPAGLRDRVREYSEG